MDDYASPAPRRLRTVTCQYLAETRYERPAWLIEGLLKPGLTVLAGAPKIGKSWMVLQLCLAVANGADFLDLPVMQGTALYIALEDSEQRLQERVLRSDCEYPQQLHFTTRCSEMGEALVEEIRSFKKDYPDTRLIVIDTFQKIRCLNSQPSYANDYLETSAIKCLADTLGVCILLVHHTRKLADTDYMNEISGTNGIAGSADTLMVLKKEKRTDSSAVLCATGRDIEDRRIEVRLDRSSCKWQVVSDSVSEPYKRELPELLLRLTDYMKTVVSFTGNNGMFCEGFAAYLKEKPDTRLLKQRMNQYRIELEEHGVFFDCCRTSSMRLLHIRYDAASDRYAADDADVTLE